MSETSRLFVAVWPPSDVVEALKAALVTEDALRWQAPARWHITVAFLGTRSMPSSLRRFEEVDLGVAGPMRLRGVGTFGPVLWVGVDSGSWLPDLVAGVREDFGVTQTRFRGHVTVARARDAVGRRALGRVRPRLAMIETQAWIPEELTLVASTVGPRAAYEVIGRRRFKGP